MDGFAFDQLVDVFLDAGHPGLGLFGVVDPVKDRVAISYFKSFEELFALLFFARAARRSSGTAPCFAAHRRRSMRPSFRARSTRSIPQAACVQLDKLKRPHAFFSDHLLAD